MRYVSTSVCLILTPLMAVLPLWADAQPGDIASTTDLHLQVVDAGNGTVAINSQNPKGLSVHVSDADGHPIKDVAVSFHLPESGASGKFADGSIAAVGYTDESGQASSPAVTWNGTAGSAPVRITATKGASHAGILLEETLTAAAASIGAAPKPAVISIASTGAAKPVAQLASPASEPHVQVNVPNLRASAQQSQTSAPPSVSVTSASPGTSTSHSKAKWYLIAGIAVAAGAGAAFAMRGKSTASTAAQSTQISIGSPSISVGHP